MTLQNLLGVSLDSVRPNRETLARLLAAAERNLADAALTELSLENRFDAAYKAILQCALAALHANGFRLLTSRTGHHQTAIQSLPKTIGLETERMVVLDALRKQRNLADYDGDPVSEAAVRECIASAQALLAHVRQWLTTNRKELT